MTTHMPAQATWALWCSVNKQRFLLPLNSQHLTKEDCWGGGKDIKADKSPVKRVHMNGITNLTWKKKQPFLRT